jgi:hypothetical protein
VCELTGLCSVYCLHVRDHLIPPRSALGAETDALGDKDESTVKARTEIGEAWIELRLHGGSGRRGF